MKNILLTSAFTIILSFSTFSQVRNIGKATLESTYSHADIHKELRSMTDVRGTSAYFDDDFFNEQLKNIMNDKRFNPKEKVQLFYLMQKKLGYAFVGVAYLPPRKNYFDLHVGKVVTWSKTKASLKELRYNPKDFLQLADSNFSRNSIIASNALLLATLLNSDSVLKSLERYSSGEEILRAANPDIFNHYVCLSASIVQNTVVTANLVKNLSFFTKQEYTEDVLCALYSKSNPLGTIKDYVLQVQNPKHDLALQTALCVLWAKVPQATFEKSIKGFIDESQEDWKKELMKNILAKKIPYNYRLSSNEQIVSKLWPDVKTSLYQEGLLITNGKILEFDPN